MFSKEFVVLQQEGFLTKSCLQSGLTQLRKANIGDDTKGLFYSASFHLSIGSERIMKLVVILNHMLQNDLAIPTDAELKKNFGHKLKRLYILCKEISKDLGLNGKGFFNEGSLEWKILHLFHEFALSSRYYNLDKLTSREHNPDPLESWWEIIDVIYSTEVTKRKRESIDNASVELCERFGTNSVTFMHGLDQELMSTLDVIRNPMLIEAAAPYCVWKTIEVLSPMHELLRELVGRIHNMEMKKGHTTPLVPYMYEFFPFLLVNRKNALKRKVWS